MDEAKLEAALENTEDTAVTEATLECPVCLQAAVHPVELPCGHIFCYLCIKGIAAQRSGGRCAICRKDIPRHVLTNPTLKDVHQLYPERKSPGVYQWFYECRGGGWWMYDERTMSELERSFEANQPTCQVLIAGHIYEIDFSKMIQYRANNPNLFRRIKRDVPTAEKRGIAGIRLQGTQSMQSGSSGSHQGTATAQAPHSSYTSYANSNPGSATVPLVNTKKRNLPEPDDDESDEDDEDDIDEEEEDSDATIEIPEDEIQEFQVQLAGTDNCVIVNAGESSSVTVSRSPYQSRNSSRNQNSNTGSEATANGESRSSGNSPNTTGETDSSRGSCVPPRSNVTSVRISSSSSNGTTNTPVMCLLIGSCN